MTEGTSSFAIASLSSRSASTAGGSDGRTATRLFKPQLVAPRRRIGRREFDFSRQVAVMGILNRTPDSFHDRGRTFELTQAVEAFHRLVEEGAAWVDVGGVPFGTEVPEVHEEEELRRVIPVLEVVRGSTEAVISVDTFRAGVARRALAAGADVINDTSGLQDPGIAEVVGETGATLVVTHSLASPPRTRLARPSYRDVVAEIVAFLSAKVELALRHGVRPEQLVVDPGHDLNKNTLHSLELTRRLDEVAALGYPTLAAVSNKDFIGESLGLDQYDRLEGTLAAAVFCVLQGARIVRLHDVAAGVRAIRMTETILGWREPAFLRHNYD